jgi:hypothetical protein
MSLRIEGQNLFVPVDDGEIERSLPELAVPATVKAWSVPTDYRDDGVFVAVTAPGDPEEIPACNPSDAVLIGVLTLEPSDAALFAAAKAARLAGINASCDAAVAALAAAYPEREIQSWPQQVKEAEALAADPQAAAPLLTAIAEARSLPVPELAARVLAKMAAYAAASGALIGRRQAAEDLIDAAETPEDIAGIAW